VASNGGDTRANLFPKVYCEAFRSTNSKLSAKIVSYQPESPLSRILGTCATAAASSMVRRGEIDSKAKAHNLDQKVLECGAQRRLRCEINRYLETDGVTTGDMVEEMRGRRRDECDRKGGSIYCALGTDKVKLVGNSRSLTHCPR
jgi:hypothetical protein